MKPSHGTQAATAVLPSEAMKEPGTASSSETRANQSTNLCRSGILGSLLSTKDKAMSGHKCNSNP